MLFRVFRRTMCTAQKNAVSSVVEIILEKPVGSLKTVKGWVKSSRKLGKVIFVDVNDGSCVNCLQVVYPKTILKSPIPWGTSVHATGTINITPQGQMELQAEEINVIGKCDVTDNYPFTPKQKQSHEYYRQYLHFRPNLRYFSSMLRFRSAASMKIHQYFNENGFVHIHTPIITSGDCEGGGETFIVKPASQELIKSMKKSNKSDDEAFFNSPAYLTVSGQLHLEAVTRSISKVYTFNPSFRAENSKSRLHLSEFYMVEAEEAFITDLESVLTRIEDCIKQVTSFLLEKHSEEFEYMLKDNDIDSGEHLKMLEDLVRKPFSVMTFSEAKNCIKKNEDKLVRSERENLYNLTKEEELFLVENNGNIPIFVINWPKNEKPFYMKEVSQDKDLVYGVDLLVPNVGELCGGSLREDDYDTLRRKLADLKMLDSLEWYLNLRKFGNVPTGGFGMGFERFLQFLLNIQNIKDAIPFPRWPHVLQL